MGSKMEGYWLDIRFILYLKLQNWCHITTKRGNALLTGDMFMATFSLFLKTHFKLGRNKSINFIIRARHCPLDDAPLIRYLSSFQL